MKFFFVFCAAAVVVFARQISDSPRREENKKIYEQREEKMKAEFLKEQGLILRSTLPPGFSEITNKANDLRSADIQKECLVKDKKSGPTLEKNENSNAIMAAQERIKCSTPSAPVDFNGNAAIHSTEYVKDVLNGFYRIDQSSMSLIIYDKRLCNLAKKSNTPENLYSCQ